MSPHLVIVMVGLKEDIVRLWSWCSVLVVFYVAVAMVMRFKVLEF
jgi:hypothetical protein